MKKVNIFYLVVTIIYIVISIFLIISLDKIEAEVQDMFPEYKSAFMTEASTIKNPKVFSEYLERTIFFMIIYILSFVLFIKKMNLKCIVFPITCFTVIEYTFFLGVTRYGSTFGWMILLYFPITILSLIATFGVGLSFDISRYKEEKNLENI